MDTKILPPRCAQCSIILTSRINIFPCGHSSFCINCLHLHYRSSSLCPSCATPSRAYGAHPVSQLHPPSSPLSSNTSFVINNNNTSDLKIRNSRAAAGSVSPSQPPIPSPISSPPSPPRPLPPSRAPTPPPSHPESSPPPSARLSRRSPSVVTSSCPFPGCAWARPDLSGATHLLFDHIRKHHSTQSLPDSLVKDLKAIRCPNCSNYFHHSGYKTHYNKCSPPSTSSNTSSSSPSRPAPSQPAAPPSLFTDIPPAPPSTTPPLTHLISPFRLWGYIPPTLWPSWRDACRPHLLNYTRSHSKHDTLRSILLLPQQLLIRTRGGYRGHQALSARLRSPRTPLPSPPPPRAPPHDPDTFAVRRAVHLISRGLTSRASRSLSQSSLAPLTPSTISALKKLHPGASAPVPPLLPDAPPLHVDPRRY